MSRDDAWDFCFKCGTPYRGEDLMPYQRCGSHGELSYLCRWHWERLKKNEVAA